MVWDIRPPPPRPFLRKVSDVLYLSKHYENIAARYKIKPYKKCSFYEHLMAKQRHEGFYIYQQTVDYENVFSLINQTQLDKIQSQTILNYSTFKIRIQKRLDNEFMIQWEDYKNGWFPILEFINNPKPKIYNSLTETQTAIKEIYSEIKKYLDSQIAEKQQEKQIEIRESTPWRTIQYNFPDNITVNV